MLYVSKSQGKLITGKYRRRIAMLDGWTLYLAEQAKVEMEKALREATQVQLYDRTTLPVTYDMLNSIGATQYYLPGGDRMVVVGYGVGPNFDIEDFEEGRSPRRYAKIRLKMRGFSVQDGHDLRMNPGTYMAPIIRPGMAARARFAQKGVLEGRRPFQSYDMRAGLHGPSNKPWVRAKPRRRPTKLGMQLMSESTAERQLREIRERKASGIKLQRPNILREIPAGYRVAGLNQLEKIPAEKAAVPLTAYQRKLMSRKV